MFFLLFTAVHHLTEKNHVNTVHVYTYVYTARTTYMVLEYSSTMVRTTRVQLYVYVRVYHSCNIAKLCADCGIPGHGRDGVTPDPSGGQVWQ